MNDSCTHLADTTDAQDWARAFCERFPNSDEDTMLTWFANAIETGRKHTNRTATANPDNPYRFTVEVVEGTKEHVQRKRWWVHLITSGWGVEYDGQPREEHLWLHFPTQAEADEHAELIRQSLRAVP